MNSMSLLEQARLIVVSAIMEFMLYSSVMYGQKGAKMNKHKMKRPVSRRKPLHYEWEPWVVTDGSTNGGKRITLTSKAGAFMPEHFDWENKATNYNDFIQTSKKKLNHIICFWVILILIWIIFFYCVYHVLQYAI